MMITPLGVGGGSHVSVMVVKVLLKACSPLTGPGGGRKPKHNTLGLHVAQHPLLKQEIKWSQTNHLV